MDAVESGDRAGQILMNGDAPELSEEGCMAKGVIDTELSGLGGAPITLRHGHG